MSVELSEQAIPFAPVVLAGGSGKRFWPRSRRARAKQVLSLDGHGTMIQQTVERLLSVAGAEQIWIITNDLLKGMIAEQLPGISVAQIVTEPAARNTAPACALAAFMLEKLAPGYVLGIFPSDHVAINNRRFSEVVMAGVALAATGDRMVVLGVPPTRAETGYGYIELGPVVDAVDVPCGKIPVRRVKRFTEKPKRKLAEEFLASGNYMWNSGIFLWKAHTLAEAIRHHCPEMAALLEKIAAAYGSPQYEKVLAELYPHCENISIDYAVLEPRSAKGEVDSEIYCLPADFGWNDLGSWSALHEHLLAMHRHLGSEERNVVEAGHHITLDSEGNYVYAPGKMVALLGVNDLVVVETPDAILVTTLEHSQNVGDVVTALARAGRDDLI